MFRPFWFIATSTVMLLSAFICVQALQSAAGVRLNLIPVAIGAVVLAALSEGQNHARRSGNRPERAIIWQLSVSMTAICVLMFDAAYAVLLSLEFAAADALALIEPADFAMSMICLALVCCVLIRFSYEAGLKLVLDRNFT